MVRRLIKGQDGKLVEEATIAGTQPAPLLTNPLAAQTGGASPDAAKMAGTRANKQSTLRKQIKSGDTLQRYKQTEDQRLQKQLGAADAQYVQTIAAVSKLPAFQKNIQAAAMEYAFGRGTGADAPSFTVKQDVVSIQAAQSGQSIEELNLAINNILAVPGAENLDAWNKIAKAVGKSVADLTWEDFSIFVPQVNELIEDTATPIFGSDVSIGDLPDLDKKLQASGFASVDALAKTLGTTADTINGMTVNQLNSVMLTLRPSFDTVEDLRRRVNDPAIGANERTEIRKRLRELGVTGVRSLEAKANQILEQVEDGDTIEFMGEQMRVEDILDDEYMSGLITEALTSEVVFNKLPPALQNYIVSNREALETATANIKTGLVARKQVIEDNRNLGTGILDSLMDVLAPGWNSSTGGRLDPAKLPPAYQTVKELDKRHQTLFLSLLRDPRWKEYAIDFTMDDLEELGFLDDPEGAFTSLATADTSVGNLRDELNTSDQIRAWMSGTLGLDPESLRTLISLGEAPPELTNLLDADRDGILDTMEAIKGRLVGMLSLGDSPDALVRTKKAIDGLKGSAKKAGMVQGLKIARAESLQTDTARQFGKGNILEMRVDDIYDNPKWANLNKDAILNDPYVPEVTKEHVRTLIQAEKDSVASMASLRSLSDNFGRILFNVKDYNDNAGNWNSLIKQKQDLMQVLASPMISKAVKERAQKAIDLINSVRVTYQGDSKGGWYDTYVDGVRVLRFHPQRSIIFTNKDGAEAHTTNVASTIGAGGIPQQYALAGIKV